MIRLFNATINNIVSVSLIVEDTTDLLKVTDKLYQHAVVPSTQRMDGIRTHNVSSNKYLLH